MNSQGRYSAKKRRVSTPRPAVVPRQTPAARSAVDTGSAPFRVVLRVFAGALLLAGVAYGYVAFWRSVPVVVNGEHVDVRIHATVEDMLDGNDFFGVKPGRLLSVSGNVIEEDGGERCTVAVGEGDNAQPLASEKFSQTEVAEGGIFTVSDGADVTEPHAETVEPLAPGVQMETGGAIQYVKQWGKAGSHTVWKGEKSGEVVDKGTIEEPQDLIIGSRNARPVGSKKYIALTFDDGPSRYTQAILDILAQKRARATFFNLGTSAAGNPALAKAVVDGGNELASHTNAHKNLPTVGADELRSEIVTAFDTLEGASGFRPQMIRAPYGAFTATEWARSADLLSCNVLWNIDTLDWKRPGADAITKTVLNQAFNGAIALMHDGGGNREQDIEALPAIIDGLRDAGYTLVTVSELMELDGTFPQDVVRGTVKMPEDADAPTVG